jgi:type II secretory pathway component PulK
MMNKKGFALLLVFAVLTALSAMLIAFLAMVSGEIRSVRAGLHNIQAFYVAEAGAGESAAGVDDRRASGRLGRNE